MDNTVFVNCIHPSGTTTANYWLISDEKFSEEGEKYFDLKNLKLYYYLKY